VHWRKKQQRFKGKFSLIFGIKLGGIFEENYKQETDTILKENYVVSSSLFYEIKKSPSSLYNNKDRTHFTP